MQKIQILVVGRNAEIVATVVRLINNTPAWNATSSLTDEGAVTACLAQHFDLVLFGGGIEPAEDAALRRALNHQQPGIHIIQHYGGGSGLLTSEINLALASLQ